MNKSLLTLAVLRKRQRESATTTEPRRVPESSVSWETHQDRVDNREEQIETLTQVVLECYATGGKRDYTQTFGTHKDNLLLQSILF